MLFNLLLAVALIICFGGLLLSVRRWFTGGVTAADRKISAGKRIGGLILAACEVFRPANALSLLKGIVYDGLLQTRLYKSEYNRWLAHFFIFWGFLPLLIFHAMDGVITAGLFPSYESTLDPWQFLRNFFGVVALGGLGMAAWRRYSERSRMRTTKSDWALLALIAGIMLSGYLLEGAKIASQYDFHRMVEDYADPDATEDVAALEALWVTKYGLAASKSGMKFTEEQMALGRELNESSCIYCHSKTQTAFVSYATSRVLTPFSRSKDSNALANFAYWLHVLLFFGALAWLPFGKLRHAVISPLSALADRYRSAEAGNTLRPVKRLLDMDACTRCGLCTENCSVGLCADLMENPYILPSEKLAALGGAPIAGKSAKDLLEGLTVCTDCRRCTGMCPVGINLQDLWDGAREEAATAGRCDVYALSPLSLHQTQVSAESFATARKQLEAVRDKTFAEAKNKETYDVDTFGGLLQGAADNGAFRLCYNCKTCTSSCPIVDLESLDGLGLAPHQIIHATALGLDDLVASSRMLWSCLGCYRCQDACPQGVRVTEVLYLHKNKALARMKDASAGKEN